jgi:hypothetical protein
MNRTEPPEGPGFPSAPALAPGPLQPILLVLLLAMLPGLGGPGGHAAGQVTWQDFVVTGGVSAEGYQGNFPTASAVVRDSTELASALVGEVGLRGALLWRRNGTVRGTLGFDGGVRQFSARGFELRDFAPREWSGTAEGTIFQPMGEVVMLSLFGRVRGRDVEDRPPMPLFLQPGYLSWAAGAATEAQLPGERRLDLRVRGEKTGFYAPQLVPQVRLLDREALEAEVGYTTPVPGASDVRVHAGVEAGRYPEQGTFDPEDPFRRDHTFSAGATWSYRGGILAQMGAEGRANRSNSRRPEYNSVTVQGLLSVPVPGDAIVTAFGALTLKRYLEPTPFARLIPGEEANNSSLAYVSMGRALARNLDGTVRAGWTRAETEIGENYFQRVGLSVLFHYRPGF